MEAIIGLGFFQLIWLCIKLSLLSFSLILGAVLALAPLIAYASQHGEYSHIDSAGSVSVIGGDEASVEVMQPERSTSFVYSVRGVNFEEFIKMINQTGKQVHEDTIAKLNQTYKS